MGDFYKGAPDKPAFDPETLLIIREVVPGQADLKRRLGEGLQISGRQGGGDFSLFLPSSNFLFNDVGAAETGKKSRRGSVETQG